MTSHGAGRAQAAYPAMLADENPSTSLTIKEFQLKTKKWLCLGVQGYLTYTNTKKTQPLRHYRRPMPRVLRRWAFSYGRGTPVPIFEQV